MTQARRGRGLQFKLTVTCALLGGFVLGGGATAAYAATVYSAWANFSAGSVAHSTRGYLTDAGVYGQQVKRANGAASPAGWLGATTNVWKSSTLCGSSGPAYNSGSLVTHIVSGSQYSGVCGAGNYAQGGTGYAYNSSTGNYVSKTSVRTPFKYISP